MYAAMKYNELILAKIAAQNIDQSGYVCPNCQKPVQLICGKNKIPYFRHQIVEVRSKETIEHFYGKKILKSALTTLNIQAKLEVPLASDALRADVLIELPKKQYSLEFQCAPLSSKEFKERHKLYQVAQIKDIWLAGKRHFLKQNLKQIHYDFMMDNQVWGTFLIEIDVQNHQINLKYNIKQHDLSRKVRYQIQTFTFDEYGISRLLNFQPILKNRISFKIQEEKEYLLHQVKQQSRIGMLVAEICYKKGITIEEIPSEYFIGWRKPGPRIYLLDKLMQ